MKNIYAFIGGAVLSLAALSTTVAQTISGSYSVQCTAYKQEQTQWCWAGATRMVDWTYSSVTPPSQCSIVNKANDQCDGIFNVCCSTLNGSRPSACTDPLGSNYPNNMSGCNGSLSWLINYYAGANSTYSNALSYSTVSSNLSANKMMVARWGWTSGGGHFVVIYACYQMNGVGQIQYANPSSGSKVTESASYFTSNSSRTWTHSIAMNGAAYRPRMAGPSVETDAAKDNLTQLYPNPTDGVLHLQRTGDLSAAAHVRISNTIGQLVYETELAENQGQLTVNLKEKLSSGLYIVDVVSNGISHTERLVIN
jgi:hypothetical protein